MKAALRKPLDFSCQIEYARKTGGCPVCFKPHDPSAPSCNRPECAIRWREQCAASQPSIEGDSRGGDDRG